MWCLRGRPDATERLLEVADSAKGRAAKTNDDLAWRTLPVEERLTHALVRGIDAFGWRTPRKHVSSRSPST